MCSSSDAGASPTRYRNGIASYEKPPTFRRRSFLYLSENVAAPCVVGLVRSASVGVVGEIVLDIHYRRALVAGARGEVRKGAQKVGEAARSGPLGSLRREKRSGLMLDHVLYGALGVLSAQVAYGVVREIFEFQFVGRAFQPRGVSRGNHGVRKFPYLADGILERAVAVHHDFHHSARLFQQYLLHSFHELVAVPGEELHAVVGGEVGSEDAVIGVIAAALDGSVHYLVHGDDLLRAGGEQQPLGAETGVYVGVDDHLGVFQYLLRTVGEDYLGVAACHLLVQRDVVHARERMLDLAERGVHLLLREHVRVRIDAVSVQRVHVHEMIAHLVGRIAEHDDQLVHALGDAFEQHGETVARKYGEDEPHRAAARLGADVLGDLIHRGVIALCARDHRLRDGEDVAVVYVETGDGIVRRREQTFRHYDGQIVALFDDGSFDTSGNRTDSCHISSVVENSDVSARTPPHNGVIILHLARDVNNKSAPLPPTNVDKIRARGHTARMDGRQTENTLRSAALTDITFRVARIGLHFYEEPCFSGENGSGTVFFSGCDMRGPFCQNSEISHDGQGVNVNGEELLRLFSELENQGAENLNLVTPTPWGKRLIPVLKEYKKHGKLPVVWNSSGYERVEALSEIDEYIDIYLLDCKTLSKKTASRFCGREKYAETIIPVMEAIKAWHPHTDLEKMKGTLLRHLVFPGELESTFQFLEYFSRHYKDNFYLSLMTQFVPPKGNPGFSPLSEDEYDSLVEAMETLGIDDGFMQDPSDDDILWIPDFTRDRPFPEPFADPDPYFLSLKGR